jgi:4-azaleucine resistance transporter AzlC
MTSTDAIRTATRKRSDFLAVTRDVGVAWASLFALGIGFGVLVTSHDLPWWLAPVISATMFAGSVEFLLIGMLAATVPIAAIATTTFLVNSRHLFYGLSFPLDRVKGRIAKAYSIFALCDEAYAIITSSDPATLTTRRISWTQLGLHFSWAGGALIGGLVGATMLSGVKGLDFVLTALFVAGSPRPHHRNPGRRGGSHRAVDRTRIDAADRDDSVHRGPRCAAPHEPQEHRWLTVRTSRQRSPRPLRSLSPFARHRSR